MRSIESLPTWFTPNGCRTFLPGLGTCFLSNWLESMGMAVKAANREPARANAMVPAKARKSCAERPVIKAMGRNITTATMVAAMSAIATSLVPISAAYLGSSPNWMCR